MAKKIYNKACTQAVLLADKISAGVSITERFFWMYVDGDMHKKANFLSRNKITEKSRSFAVNIQIIPLKQNHDVNMESLWSIRDWWTLGKT